MAFVLESGSFESTLDDKGRVVIPASLRERYQGELVITQGRDFCVWLMTVDAFKEYQKYIEDSMPQLSFDEYDAIQRQHIVPAQLVEVDQKSGRVSVPAALRSYARLSKDCTILSITGFLEVWNTDAYRTHSMDVKVKANEVSRKLGPFRFIPKEGQS